MCVLTEYMTNEIAVRAYLDVAILHQTLKRLRASLFYVDRKPRKIAAD